VLELGSAARRARDDGKIRREAGGLIVFLFVVMTFGALMAGLRAGSAHNTFPTMSGYWIPPGMLTVDPWWLDPFENGTTVQFIHRLLATLLALGVLAMAIRVRRSETLLAGAMALLQFGLGAATILSGVSLPIAVAHQAGAVLLLTTLLVVRHRASRPSGSGQTIIVGA
jgi:cytochrome c oxidase assembly protein subunit 15